MQKIASLILLCFLLPAVIAVTVTGCGDEGPAEAIEAFLDATKAKDCAGMVDGFHIESFGGDSFDREALIRECEDSFIGELESYKIIEETVDGDKATLKVEMVNRYDDSDETATETFTFEMIKTDEGWRLVTAS